MEARRIGQPGRRAAGTGEIAKLRAFIAEHVPAIITKLVEAAKGKLRALGVAGKLGQKFSAGSDDLVGLVADFRHAPRHAHILIFAAHAAERVTG